MRNGGAIREEDKPRMSVEIKFMTTVKYTWQNNKTNENILSKLKINLRITEINGYKMLGKWTEQTTAISTMWEMKPRMTPQKTSRLLMGLEQVIRPKTLQAIWWWYDKISHQQEYWTQQALHTHLIEEDAY